VPVSGVTGFTLIELLVAVAIIGLLATLVAVAISNARSKSRDGLRKGNLSQVKNALELHYQQYGAFPVSSGSGANFDCLHAIQDPDKTQFEAYIKPIPTDPLALAGRDSVGNGCFAYRSSGTQYKIAAALELDTDIMANDGGVNSCWFELYTSGGQAYDPGGCP
jgi:prepilin-type N-terminal cleavage/methylation domain-containing protein